MPRIPKPVLWWSSEDDGSGALSAALTNKKVWLNGLGILHQTPFQIRRRNLLTRTPWLGRRLFGAWIGDIPTIYPGAGVMRSQTYWQAANVSWAPSSVDYFFVDGHGGVSGSLAVSNTPTFQWRSVRHGGAGLNPKIDAGLSLFGTTTAFARAELVHLGREYEHTFEGVVLAPRDPAVEIEVLEPGTSRDLLLESAREALEHELGDLPGDRRREYLASALAHVDTFLGRRYVDFTVDGETRFIATSGESSPVSLTVRGDGPVRLLFAIRVHNLEARTSSISEFMPVVVTQPG